jgi:hydroxymethylbilane synthase
MAEARLSIARTLVIGTRASALARWQTEWAAAALKGAWPGLTIELRPFTTSGDRQLDQALPAIGGKGVFTEELESALRAHEIDLAVHSLKDLPVAGVVEQASAPMGPAGAPGLTLGAIGPREDARDVLIAAGGHTLAGLPPGARVGTSSPRRAAQLLAARPDLQLLPLRGNVDSRVRKALAGEYDAIVLAAAGLLRLGLGQHASEYLSFETMLPAPGQGAIAVQCRVTDTELLAYLRPLDDAGTRAAVGAERAFLAGLGGGCAAPIAAYATIASGSKLSLSGLVAAVDGKRVVRVAGAGDDPQALGAELAAQALAQGAHELLA